MDLRRQWIAHLITVAVDHPHVWEEDMAAGIVAGQGLVRWDHERVVLKTDDVLIVRTWPDLLGLQLMLVCVVAAVRLDPVRGCRRSPYRARLRSRSPSR